MPVRTANIEDAERISELYSTVWSEYTDRFPEELLRARCPTPKETLSWLENDIYFVAELETNIVGVVGCSHRHGTCCLIRMVVDPRHRRKGIGQTLVDAVISNAKEMGAVKVWLDTLPFLQDAIALYEKNGFKKCGHFRNHLWGLDLELYELVF